MIAGACSGLIMTNSVRSSDPFLRKYLPTACAILALTALLLPVVISAQSKPSYSFATLYTFTGPDGANPTAGVIFDASGNLYGTTLHGGAAKHWGSVFELDTTGKETVLHSFHSGQWGYYPGAGLTLDSSGNLYGTTDGNSSYAGTVFRLNTADKQLVLHQFAFTDGAAPNGLIRDKAGNLYGTTATDGPDGDGTVFKVSVSGKLTTLYSFTGGADGASPIAGVIRDSAGNLYGTTGSGGSGGGGTVFKLDTAGQFTVLYSFTGGTDGGKPAGLIEDHAGNLYGTTVSGGDLKCGSGRGCGTIFEVDTTGQETVLHSFTGKADGGYSVLGGGLVFDYAENIYGTTETGGASGGGTLFKLHNTGKFATIYSFTGKADGKTPYGLSRDKLGYLYGTTEYGGDPTCNCGTVFKMHPD
jgi:uncharacterized repeat protein (TIGR03803 family)